MNPIISELTSELDDKVTIEKVKVDQQPQLAKEYGIQSIPTFFLFQHGQV
jgi:thioredoxin